MLFLLFNRSIMEALIIVGAFTLGIIGLAAWAGISLWLLEGGKQ